MQKKNYRAAAEIQTSEVAKSEKIRGLRDQHLRIRHPLIRVCARVELQANTTGFKCLCKNFVVFVNRRCLYSIQIKEKKDERNQRYFLFPVTHLNHELTRRSSLWPLLSRSTFAGENWKNKNNGNPSTGFFTIQQNFVNNWCGTGFMGRAY